MTEEHVKWHTKESSHNNLVDRLHISLKIGKLCDNSGRKWLSANVFVKELQANKTKRTKK